MRLRVCCRLAVPVALALMVTLPAIAVVTAVNLPSTFAFNTWADGTWHVRAIHVTAADVPVGPLSSEVMITLSSQAPNADPVVPVDIPANDQIWFYRKLGGPISVGESLEVFKVTCPMASPSICEAANTGVVFLSDGLFLSPEVVVPVELLSFDVE